MLKWLRWKPRLDDVAREAGTLAYAIDRELHRLTQLGEFSEDERSELRPFLIGSVAAFALVKLKLSPSDLGDPKRGDATGDDIVLLYQKMADASGDDTTLRQLIVDDGVGIALVEVAESPPPELHHLAIPALFWRRVSDYVFGSEPESPDGSSPKRRLLAQLVLRAHDELLVGSHCSRRSSSLAANFSLYRYASSHSARISTLVGIAWYSCD